MYTIIVFGIICWFFSQPGCLVAIYSVFCLKRIFFHESLVFIYNYLFKQNSLCWIRKQWREGVLCWT